MRRLFAIAAMFLIVSAAGPAAAAREPEIIQTHEVGVGEIHFFKLPGEPKFGYKWRLNTEMSTGLDLVTVDLLGWLLAPEARSLFFKENSLLNVSVKGKAPGQADLAFDYYRSLAGRSLSRTSLVRVIVKQRARADGR